MDGECECGDWTAAYAGVSALIRLVWPIGQSVRASRVALAPPARRGRHVDTAVSRVSLLPVVA